MSDWQNWLHLQAGDSDTAAHPSAPAGSGGPGSFRTAGPLNGGSGRSSMPHPNSPAGRSFGWTFEFPQLVMVERAKAVYQSIMAAQPRLPAALLEATGMELHAAIAGIVPGLLMFLGVLCATTVLGAAAGAAIGFLFAGVGAVPGAAVGAEAGLDAGIALLDFLGLAFLATYIGKSLLSACKLAGHAVSRAWHSIDRPSTQQQEIEVASKEYAQALALVFRGVLQGLVAYLLAKGTAAAASRVPEMVANLRRSKLGAGFANWVEKNWQALVDNPKLKDAPPRANRIADDGQSSRAGKSSSKPTPAKPPISKATSDSIIAQSKPNRPDPSTYLSKDYIDAHLAQFDGGTTKIMGAAPAGTVGPPGGTFVMPTKFVDDMVAQSGGDVGKLESLLSLPPGYLGANPVRVDIPSPSNLRMPDGNELGANDQWLPGGFTGGGVPEATIDPAAPGTYSVSDVFPKTAGP